MMCCADVSCPGKLRNAHTRIGERLNLAGLSTLVGAVTMFVGACSHAPPPPTPEKPLQPCPSPEPLRISLHASPFLNPSEKGDPLATVVRVYQLKGTGKISVASFDDVLDHDRDALGEDFVAVQELTVSPGSTVEPPLVRSSEATHVAVVALFRSPASTTWRTIQKLPPPDPQYCHPPANGHRPGRKDPTLYIRMDESRLSVATSS
jgi:type VI secretion system VasD/TssJ family lipoprotein